MVQVSENCRLTLMPLSTVLGKALTNCKHARSSASCSLAVPVAVGTVGIKSTTSWASCSGSCSPAQPSGTSWLSQKSLTNLSPNPNLGCGVWDCFGIHTARRQCKRVGVHTGTDSSTDRGLLFGSAQMQLACFALHSPTAGHAKKYASTASSDCPTWLGSHLSIFHKLHVEAITDRAKLQHVEQFSSNSTSSSIVVYRTLQPEHRYAEYLSSVRCFSNRRLLSRFRCGCHGLHVDTGRWVDTKREDRLCQVCHSSWKTSSISCLVAQLTVMLDKSMPVFFSRPLLSQTFSLTLNQMHVVVFSESVFHLENLLYPPDISMNACLCVVFCLLAPCWSPGH